MKVVLDTNVIVSAFLFPQRPIGKILQFAQEGRFEIVLSGELFHEYQIKLLKLADKLAFSKTEIVNKVFALQTIAVKVVLKEIPEVTRDPKDDMLIATAAVSKADYLVSGDEDILVLGKDYKGVKIVKPSKFLELI